MVDQSFPDSLPVPSADFTPDVIVIGAGTAGLAFAHAAGERGARVLLVEKNARIGGALYLSTGMFSAGGTRLQRQRGITDSPEDHFRDVVRISKGTVNEALTRKYCELAPAMVDWLQDQGFEFAPEAPAVLFGHEAYEVPRIYWGVAGGRSVLRLYQRLLAPLVEAGTVRYLLGTPVDKLLVHDGRVTGVRAGSREFHAPAVLLATGGYGSSPELFARFTQGRRLVSAGAPGSTGDGIKLGESVGAAVGGSEYFLPTFAGIEDVVKNPGRIVMSHPDSWDTNPTLTPQIRPAWEVWVNVHGERFCREDEGSVDNRERALRQQEDMRLWAVFDEAILDAAPPMVKRWPAETVRELADEGRLVKRADTLEELAFRMDVSATGLRTSIDAYNLALQGGLPDPMGREHRPLPVIKPPFYAIRMQGYVVRTWAGLQADTELEVVDAKGQPIPGLYAVGETLGAATFSGDSFVAGMSIGPAITFARYLAGQLTG